MTSQQAYAPGEFSVAIFFPDGSYEYVRRYVSAEEAVHAAQVYTSNPAAKLGITKRVIITDGGDCCNWEWQAGKGVVFPPPPGADAPIVRGGDV
jgi:hypothetical protein